MRLKIIRIIFYLGFVMLACTLFYHQVIQGEFYRRLSKNNRIRVVPLEAKRGTIYDRNGQVLVQSHSAHDVLVIPQDVEDLYQLIMFLSRVLNEDPVNLRRLYQSRRLNPFTPVVLAEDLTREQVFAIEEERFRFPGLWVEQGYQRQYPSQETAAHLLGYVGKINVAERAQLKQYGISQLSLVGKDGIEKYYDRELGGIEGGLQVEVNSRGEQVRFLGVHDPVAGDDITLTIDGRLQAVAAQVLVERVGSVVVMDNDSGEILAMTSAPTFNPNDFTDRARNQNISGLFADSDAPLLNRAIRGQFPPGSVFKVVVAVAALSEQIMEPRKTFYCSGSYKLGNRKFGCTHDHGAQDLFDAVAHSCNIYFYNLALLMKPEQIYRYGHMFGLGLPTGIDLPYEQSGFLPSSSKKSPRGHEPWVTGDMLNYSIGQGGLLTTPLQLVNMMAAVARDGVMVKPHLIKDSTGHRVKDYSTEEKIPVSSDIFNTVHKGLRDVVETKSGTAHALDIDGLYVAGKTGTAQSSGKKADHSWFVGYARGSVRNIAFCVFLEHGGSSYNAVVLTKDLLLKMREMQLL